MTFEKFVFIYKIDILLKQFQKRKQWNKFIMIITNSYKVFYQISW